MPSADSRCSNSLSISEMTPASAPSAPFWCRVVMTKRRRYAVAAAWSMRVCGTSSELIVAVMMGRKGVEQGKDDGEMEVWIGRG
jgi:hypothetical protein